MEANASSLGNFEKLLNFSKSKDGICRSYASHIDTAMRNEAGANRVVLNGEVMRVLFLLTEYPWPVDERYRLYAEVFRGYLGNCEQGVSYLKEKRVLMNAMATAYEAYMRNSRMLTGLELQLRTTLDNASVIVNQVHDSYQNWETKDRA